jgi:hypothetical protein
MNNLKPCDLASKLDEALLKLNLETRNANDAYMARAKATTERDDALAKLAKCREALERICGDATIAYQQTGSHRELFMEISNLARETLDATK